MKIWFSVTLLIINIFIGRWQYSSKYHVNIW